MILNSDIVNAHRQIDQWSCIPMAIEFILKLLGRMPPDSYELQKAWCNRSDGDFGVFDGNLIHGVRFRRLYWMDRNEEDAMNAIAEQALILKIKTLTPQQVAEVEDFV